MLNDENEKQENIAVDPIAQEIFNQIKEKEGNDWGKPVNETVNLGPSRLVLPDNMITRSTTLQKPEKDWYKKILKENSGSEQRNIENEVKKVVDKTVELLPAENLLPLDSKFVETDKPIIIPTESKKSTLILPDEFQKPPVIKSDAPLPMPIDFGGAIKNLPMQGGGNNPLIPSVAGPPDVEKSFTQNNVVKIDINVLRQYKLFIATPMYGGQCAGLYTKSVIDLSTTLNAHRIENRFSFLFNESLITRARNYLADEFLRSGYTHLLFLDSDIEFEAKDILHLLWLDKDIIGAPYTKKSINWNNIKEAIKKNPEIDPSVLASIAGDYVFNPVPGTKNFSVLQPLEVMEIGTGYMLIKRHVFDKYAEDYPHLKYKPDHLGQANFDGSRYIHAYFDTVIDPNSERYLSEDYMFCQNWRAIGGQIWLCPWMKTSHVGSYHFRGDMGSIANILGKM